MMLEYIYQNLYFMFVRSRFRRGGTWEIWLHRTEKLEGSQISWDISKVMQLHSMTEGTENLNLNGKHLATELEVFSEKTISLFTAKFAILGVLLW